MIWLTQWLCPQRHASICFVWDPLEENQPDVVRKGEALFEKGIAARICGICGSTDLTPMHDRTRFHTMEEAAPTIKRTQERNDLARHILGDPTPINTDELPYPTIDDFLKE